MRRAMRFGWGKALFATSGIAAALMFIPAGDGDTTSATATPAPTALSTSPELASFLDNAVDPKPAAKTAAEVIAEAAATPEPGQPVPNLDVPTAPATTVASLSTAESTQGGPRELASVRSAVNMRAGPSTKHATLFVLEPDEQVAVLARDGSWAKVEKPNGATGWVYSRYLGIGGGDDDVDTTVTGSIEPVNASVEPETASVQRIERPVRKARIEAPRDNGNLAAIRLRAGPSARAQTIFTIEPGTRLRIAERRNGWARVVAPGGVSGWVRVR